MLGVCGIEGRLFILLCGSNAATGLARPQRLLPTWVIECRITRVVNNLVVLLEEPLILLVKQLFRLGVFFWLDAFEILHLSFHALIRLCLLFAIKDLYQVGGIRSFDVIRAIELVL